MLLCKLYKYGLRGVAYDWIKSFLINRQQYVFIKRPNGTIATSNCSTSSFGIPQGTVVGTCLYLIYVNSIIFNNDEEIKTLMFADDTTVLVSCNTTFNTEIKTNTILNSLLQSFSQHNLYINKQKTNIIHFTTKNSKQPHLPAVFLADSILPHTSTTKFLGLLINENLSWNDHVKYLKSKLNSSLFILRRIIHNCDQNTAFSVYHGLIISLMSYGISLWGASSTNNLKDVLVIQKRALRYILSLNKKQSCRPYFKQHNLLTHLDTS